MKKHETRRKGFAKIKHGVSVNHVIPNADDDDATPVLYVGDDNNDALIVGHNWDRSCCIEVLIKKATLQSKK